MVFPKQKYSYYTEYWIHQEALASSQHSVPPRYSEELSSELAAPFKDTPCLKDNRLIYMLGQVI